MKKMTIFCGFSARLMRLEKLCDLFQLFLSKPLESGDDHVESHTLKNDTWFMSAETFTNMTTEASSHCTRAEFFRSIYVLVPRKCPVFCTIDLKLGCVSS